MFLDLVITISIATPVVFVFMVLFIQALLDVARYFNGVSKFIFAMAIYIIFTAVLVAPLLFLIDNIRLELKQSIWYLLSALVAYALIVAPAFIYLQTKRINELQSAGYFLPK